MAAVRTIGIFSKPNSTQAMALVPELLAWLEPRGIGVRLDLETARYAHRSGFERADVPQGCDLAVVLGGDGTLLSAARAVGNGAIPLLAVNLGGLGFLTSISTQDLFPELESAQSGDHRVTRRKMLRVSLQREGAVVAEYQALNDVVIAKSAIARIVDLAGPGRRQFHLRIQSRRPHHLDPDRFHCILPSAGGPIVFPTVKVRICLTSSARNTDQPVLYRSL